MRRSLKSHNTGIPRSRKHQRGYMMITLMLVVALMTVAMLAVLPAIRLQVQRDREEELRHRGTAYMRAIQHFYKKFGRYPSRIEDLESTNNLRFLRKRYTDPVSIDKSGKEKDFKLLHQQDVTLNNGPVLGLNPGQAPPGQFGSPGLSGLSGSSAGPGGLANQAGAIQGALQGMNNAVTQATVNNNTANNSGGDANTDSTAASSGSGSGPSSAFGFSGQTFGGGPILGVASTSKARSVRIFFEKNHYNDWLFIDGPQAARGGLLTGPINPGMPTGNLNGGIAPGAGGNLPGQGVGQGISPNSAPPNAPQQPQNPAQTPDQ